MRPERFPTTATDYPPKSGKERLIYNIANRAHFWNNDLQRYGGN